MVEATYIDTAVTLGNDLCEYEIKICGCEKAFVRKVRIFAKLQKTFSIHGWLTTTISFENLFDGSFP
jgi:hypothetical protein